MIKSRQALFNWYLRFSFFYRDTEELLVERGCLLTIQAFDAGFSVTPRDSIRRWRRKLKPTDGSWRVDGTYTCQSGNWRYLYRAVDFTGATLEFQFPAYRDAAAAKQFAQEALQAPGHCVLGSSQ